MTMLCTLMVLLITMLVTTITSLYDHTIQLFILDGMSQITCECLYLLSCKVTKNHIKQTQMGQQIKMGQQTKMGQHYVNVTLST